MTTKLIPFTIERWKEGLKPVTRDGTEVEQLTRFTTLSDLCFGGVCGNCIGLFREDDLMLLTDSPPIRELSDAFLILEKLMECSMADPGKGKTNEGRWTTINAPAHLVDEARAILEAAREGR